MEEEKDTRDNIERKRKRSKNVWHRKMIRKIRQAREIRTGGGRSSGDTLWEIKSRRRRRERRQTK